LTEIFFAQALQRAKELDDNYAKTGLTGPLFGLPISLKDQFEIKGTGKQYYRLRGLGHVVHNREN
jgi:Asp-tRNA(Asn)/Glu-tRNA(Gln) amidotransferase A subunit family amidase